MRRWMCVVIGCLALVFYAQAESVRLEALQWAMVGGNDALAMTKIGATFLDWSEGDSRASSTYSLEPYTTASGYFAGIVSDSRGVPSGFVLSRLVYRSTSIVKGRVNLLMQVRLPTTATRIYPLGFAVVSPRSMSSSSSYSLNNYSRPVGRSNVEAVLRYGFSALVSRRATKYYSSSARWSASVNYLPPPGGYGSLSDNTCFVPFESQEAIQLCEQLLSATESSLEALGQAELKQQKNFAKEAIYQEVDLQLLGGSRSAGQTRSATSGQVARPPAKATPKVVLYRFAFPEDGGVHRFEPSEPLAFDRYSIPAHRDKIALPETLTRLTAQGFTFDINISFRRQPGTLFSLQWGRETLEVSFEPSTVVLRLNNRLLTKSPIPEPEAEALRMTLTYYPTKQSTRLYLYLNEQKVWNGPLAEPSEAGVAGLWIRAAYSSANNGQNGVNAWALYASAVGPKVLTPPEELTRPDDSAEE